MRTQRYLGAMFSAARQYSTKVVTPREYFFVDTNIIVGYRRKQYEKLGLGLSRFIEHPNHTFFYTETVLSELQRVKQFAVPESREEDSEDKKFKFVHSGLLESQKKDTIQFLHESWQAEFGAMRKAVQKGFGLDEEQLQRFQNDLFIIFESGYACHQPGVLPENDFRTAPLVTNNMRLVNKFLTRERVEHLLENVVNLSGMEHLIPVQLLKDTMDAWEISMKNEERAAHDSTTSSLLKPGCR